VIVSVKVSCFDVSFESLSSSALVTETDKDTIVPHWAQQSSSGNSSAPQCRHFITSLSPASLKIH
jgi:hypothetical protein